MAPALFQAVYYTQDGGVLLTNGDIDTDHILAALVDNGINTNGSLTGLLIADDQLTLTLTDGDHRVDGLDTGLYRLIYRAALDNAISRRFYGADIAASMGPLASMGAPGH